MTHATQELSEALQSLNPGDKVELFELDLNPIGVDEIGRFSPTNLGGAGPVVWDGNTYIYAPISLTGVEWNANGDPPNPKVFFPNGSKYVSERVIAYQDLVGAKLTRIRVFAQFLDDAPLADTNAVLSRDVFRVQQKLNMNKMMGEFSLRPLYNIEDRKLPGRVCLKTLCSLRYRTWDAVNEVFDYSKATCPWTGTTYFDSEGASTTEEFDACGHRLSDCLDRYGETVDLPFGGFPGMTRLRI